MSKFDLRDISQRLSSSRDTEAVVFEFLGYLQAVRSDWRASIAFYEVSRDALVNVYTRQGPRLTRRDVHLPVDQLPPRLVRKFFHPSAFFNASDRRSLLANVFQSSPSYEPDALELPALQPILPTMPFQSSVCLPLADQEDLLALLTVTSEKRGAFGSRVVGEIIPLKSMAALALAQHLHRALRAKSDDAGAAAAAVEFQERIRRLNVEATSLAQDNQQKSAKLQALTQELELLDRNSTSHKQELDHVKQQLNALEEQTTAAQQHLADARDQLLEAQGRVQDSQRTLAFLKEVFQVLSQEHDASQFSGTFVSWFCQHFGVERCSLMLLDDARETMRISAQQGIDPRIAKDVRVRVGQGIAGWVAHNRKPLHVRVKNDAGAVRHTGQDVYNSDSFISVPLVHDNRLAGVLNLSNKGEGAPFTETDLDRAVLAGSVLAMTLGRADAVRRAGAWG